MRHARGDTARSRSFLGPRAAHINPSNVVLFLPFAFDWALVFVFGAALLAAIAGMAVWFANLHAVALLASSGANENLQSRHVIQGPSLYGPPCGDFV